MSVFREILANIGSQEDRELAEGLLNKYPEFDRAGMRQSDYSRQLDQFKQAQSRFAEIEELANDWNKWAEENWDFEAKSTKAEVELRQKNAELEKFKEDQMTFEQIKQWTKEQGLISQSELAEREQNVINELRGSTYVHAKITEFGGRHMKDFNEPFKATEFLAELTKSGINDLEKAYELHTQGRRTQAEEARRKEELEAAVKQAEIEGRKKAIEEFNAINRNGNTTPDDNGTHDPGYFQKVIHGAPEGEVNTPAIGKGIARIAAEEYRRNQLQSAS